MTYLHIQLAIYRKVDHGIRRQLSTQFGSFQGLMETSFVPNRIKPAS